MSDQAISIHESWLDTCRTNRFLQEVCGDQLDTVIHHMTDGPLTTLKSLDIPFDTQTLKADLAVTRQSEEKWKLDLVFPNAAEEIAESLHDASPCVTVADPEHELLRTRREGDSVITERVVVGETVPARDMHVISYDGGEARTNFYHHNRVLSEGDEVKQHLTDALKTAMGKYNISDQIAEAMTDKSFEAWRTKFTANCRRLPSVDTCIKGYTQTGCNVLSLSDGKQVVYPAWKIVLPAEGEPDWVSRSSRDVSIGLLPLDVRIAPEDSGLRLFKGKVYLGTSVDNAALTIGPGPHPERSTSTDASVPERQSASVELPSGPLPVSVPPRGPEARPSPCSPGKSIGPNETSGEGAKTDAQTETTDPSSDRAYHLQVKYFGRTQEGRTGLERAVKYRLRDDVASFHGPEWTDSDRDPVEQWDRPEQDIFVSGGPLHVRVFAPLVIDSKSSDIDVGNMMEASAKDYKFDHLPYQERRKQWITGTEE